MRALLLLVAMPALAAPPRTCPPIAQAAPAVDNVKALWATEAKLLMAPPCVEAVKTSPDVTLPTPLEAPVRLPRPPEGPGAGPWILLGLAAACAAGVGTIDFLANGARDDFAAARSAGDRDAEDDARGRLGQQQQIAWAVAGVGLGALVGSAVWFAVGGDDDPPQTYPVFQRGRLGWGGSF